MNFSGLKYYLTFTLWLDILPIKFFILKKTNYPSQSALGPKLKLSWNSLFVKLLLIFLLPVVNHKVCKIIISWMETDRNECELNVAPQLLSPIKRENSLHHIFISLLFYCYF